MSEPTNPEQRVAELELQLTEVRQAALSMVVGMADAVTSSPKGRADLAQGFEDVAKNETGEMHDLAQLVAAALRAK